ncbi:MAG: hypothetical protein M1828_007666 [Chrysothrix sp. TS-e1954]|nr:MAG: hypothetical protein M1828_007666 [Chrysothrix sp. TS-e1954]
MTTTSELTFTSIEDIPKIASSLRNTFASQKTKPIAWRLVQLRKLYWGLKDNEKAIAEACKSDLNKGEFETYLTETGWCMNDVIFVANSLEKWAKDEPAPDIDLMNKAFSPKIRKDPLGCVLIIGTYNFPIQLTIGPIIGAIAGGNTVCLKPSESAPAAARVVEHIICTSLDPSAFTVVQGAIPETTALLEEKWDKIFYTGSGNVAKIIAKKAAETLTPITLELGGKNPAIVTKNADPRLAARRLLWGKTVNAGQVCVSQNYIIIDEGILPLFLNELKGAISEFFPDGFKASKDYGRIVNARQFQRLKKMLDSTSGRILLGGTMDESTLFMEPTVVQVTSPEDSLLVDESFGPLIPILPVKDLDTAIRCANDVSGTPLGLYAFGSKAETSRILNETRSGGATIGDGFYHAAIPTLQFGGVGESGQGSYRGRASFECFVHRRSVATTPSWAEGLLAVRSVKPKAQSVMSIGTNSS